MTTAKFWVVIAAAGSARRMAGAGLPKQYLQLAGRSVIEWAIAPFLERADCERIVVVLAERDRHWRKQSLAHDPQDPDRDRRCRARRLGALRVCARLLSTPPRTIGCWCTTLRARVCEPRTWIA